MLFSYFFETDRKGMVFLITHGKEDALVTLFIRIFIHSKFTQQIFIEHIRCLHALL